MIECDESLVDTLLNKIKNKFGNIFSVTKSKKWIIEICPKEHTKGDAVRYLSEHFGIPKEKTMCIGDSYNDLTMFEQTGFSVAVSNSYPDVKEKADYVTASNNQSGVGKAINFFAYY